MTRNDLDEWFARADHILDNWRPGTDAMVATAPPVDVEPALPASADSYYEQPRNRTAQVTVEVTPEQMQAAFREIGQVVTVFVNEVVVPLIGTFARAVVEATERLGRWWAAVKPFVEDLRRAQAIEDHGPDNETQDGAWLSNMCAAWVHDACPAHDWCDCSCHSA